MNRTLDMKARVGRKLVKSEFGWWPTGVARLLIVPDEMTTRRIVARHSVTMSTLYPARGRDIRSWLHEPRLPFSGIWFLSEVAHSDMISDER